MGTSEGNTTNNTKTIVTESGRHLQSDGNALIIKDPDGKQQTVYCSQLTDRMIKEIAHNPDEAKKMLECCRHDIQKCSKHNCPECKICPQENGSSGSCAFYKNKPYVIIASILAVLLNYSMLMTARYSYGLPLAVIDLIPVGSSDGIWGTIVQAFLGIARLVITTVLGPFNVMWNVGTGPERKIYLSMLALMGIMVSIVVYPYIALVAMTLLLIWQNVDFTEIWYTQSLTKQTGGKKKNNNNSSTKHGVNVNSLAKQGFTVQQIDGNYTIGTQSSSMWQMLNPKKGKNTVNPKKLTKLDFAPTDDQVAKYMRGFDAVHKKISTIKGNTKK